MASSAVRPYAGLCKRNSLTAGSRAALVRYLTHVIAFGRLPRWRLVVYRPTQRSDTSVDTRDQILGVREETLDADHLASYLASCQHVYGGIGKAPGEMADPYHTYLSLAIISLSPPSSGDASWQLAPIDARINGTNATIAWVRGKISSQS